MEGPRCPSSQGKYKGIPGLYGNDIGTLAQAGNIPLCPYNVLEVVPSLAQGEKDHPFVEMYME